MSWALHSVFLSSLCPSTKVNGSWNFFWKNFLFVLWEFQWYLGHVSPGLSATRDLSPYCQLRLHFQLVTVVQATVNSIMSCCWWAWQGCGCGAIKTEILPQNIQNFNVGKRVEISWVCQINTNLVVSHKARLAHHQYCFTRGVDLGFTFFGLGRWNRAGSEPPVWVCCGTVVKGCVACGALHVGAHSQSHIFAWGIGISAERGVFLSCLYWSKPHSPLKSMLLHQCKNGKKTQTQPKPTKIPTTKLQEKGGNAFGISFSGS